MSDHYIVKLKEYASIIYAYFYRGDEVVENIEYIVRVDDLVDFLEFHDQKYKFISNTRVVRNENGSFLTGIPQIDDNIKRIKKN